MELSIEEKAKRYDEAIEIAKEINNEQKAQPFNVMTRVFPELKESEDESIRKWIIGVLSTYEHDRDLRNAAIAYLEKQGEQKPADKVEPKFKIGDRVIGIVSGMSYFITEVCDDHYNTESGCIITFNAQNNFELVEQKPAWSEEDEEKVKAMCEEGNLKPSERAWLKSLKDRVQPQPHWKPSDEQLYWLKWAVNRMPDTEKANEAEAVLEDLLEQLKKLK